MPRALVAQLDRVLASEAKGQILANILEVPNIQCVISNTRIKSGRLIPCCHTLATVRAKNGKLQKAQQRMASTNQEEGSTFYNQDIYSEKGRINLG